jgi:hypothetical protein
MSSLVNNDDDEIGGFPVVIQNAVQNGEILVFNNGRWISGNIAATGGIAELISTGSGASIIFGEFAGIATLKSIAGNSDVTVTALAQTVQIGLNTLLSNIQQINSATNELILPNLITTNRIRSNVSATPVIVNSGIYFADFGNSTSTNFAMLNNTPNFDLIIRDDEDNTDRYFRIRTEKDGIPNIPFTIDNTSRIFMNNLSTNLSPTEFITLNGTQLTKSAITSIVANVANVGTGNGLIYKDTTTSINLRRILSGQNIIVNTTGDNVVIETDADPSFNSISGPNPLEIFTAIKPQQITDASNNTGSNGQFLGISGGFMNWQNIPSAPVNSVFGRTGIVVAQEGDYSLGQLSDVTITSPSTGNILTYNGSQWVNSPDGVDINIYNSDGTLTGFRTLFGGGNDLSFNQCRLLLQGDSYTLPSPTSNATDCCMSINVSNGATASMWLPYNSKTYKTAIPPMVNQADWVQFYQRIQTANQCINMRVTYNIQGQNDGSALVWHVFGNLTAPQNIWLNIPPVSCNNGFGNAYALEAFYTSNIMLLRFIKTRSNGINPIFNGFATIMDNSDENGTAAYNITTGSSGTFALSYYPNPRTVIQNNNGATNPPSILFNYIPGYQVSVEMFVTGDGGNDRVTMNVSINGFIFAIARGIASGVDGGVIILLPTEISTLNAGLIISGTNTLSFSASPYTSNQSYSVVIKQFV